MLRVKGALDACRLCVEVRRMLCSRLVQKMFFESSSPVVRKGGARETRHQLSLRTGPIQCGEVSIEIASQFEDTLSKSVRKFFVLPPQSGSELDESSHVPVLSRTRFEVHVLCGDQNTSFCRCAGLAQRDGFVLSRLCREFL